MRSAYAILVALGATLASAPAFAYGEQAAGVPSHQERLLHVLTNQVRQAPHEWPGWDTSKASSVARDPVAYDPGLIDAARFHADDMSANDCFQHESCDGTTFSDRLRRFFSGPSGENIYTSFGDDSARAALTAWMNSSTGHRENILNSDWTHLGTGFSGAGQQVFYVQDFGLQSDATVPVIPAAAVEFTSGGKIRIIANYFDPAGRAPEAVEAIVGTRTLELETIVGSPDNQTLAVEIDVPEGCQQVHVLAVTHIGETVTFPTTGALLAGETCTAEFESERTFDRPPDRPVVDADIPETGCTATRHGERTAGPVALALVFLLALRRRRR